MLTAAASLVELFGSVPKIGELVQDFDFSKVDVKDNTREDYLTVALAPSYGELTKSSIKSIDEDLKVMIAGTVKTLANIPSSERTWDKIVSTMMQCSIVEPAGEAITRADALIKSGTNVFKFDGSPDVAIVKEVVTWFTKLINDEDVLRSTKIDINVLAQIVAQTGATIDSFETFFFKQERHEKTLVDIGILRFPDLKTPHFKLYRIQLTAWSQSKRVLMVQDDQNGITGEFIVRKFKPRKELLDRMSGDALKKAAKEAEDMFA